LQGVLYYIEMDKSAQTRKKVADRINALLEEKGWSQAQLARETGIGKGRISVICGGTENLSLDTITRLEVALKDKIIEVL
jgi:transcriptional regulator with XRE-family HTH domain